jgi:hypothetical protein
VTAMTAGSSVITCPACQKKNRIRPSPSGTHRCGACRQPLPWLIEATDATLHTELQASVPVLLDFIYYSAADDHVRKLLAQALHHADHIDPASPDETEPARPKPALVKRSS